MLLNQRRLKVTFQLTRIFCTRPGGTGLWCQVTQEVEAGGEIIQDLFGQLSDALSQNKATLSPTNKGLGMQLHNAACMRS